MHDRRIDGQAVVFGNAGRLYMNAMTWYDHDTQSIWSQPWGRAIEGSLTDIELALLPSQVTTWASWKAEHAGTLAMTNGAGSVSLPLRQGFRTDFVVGLILAGQAKAYYFEDVAAVGVINDTLGDFPILVWAAGDRFHAYVRPVEGRTLTFGAQGDGLIDQETGSRWDVARGLAVEGPLRGHVLQGVPSSTAYDWAWRDFYPDSEFYSP